MGFALALYAAFVTALTIAEHREDGRAQYLFKPACALGFILIALMGGALETRYGQIILAALCLCAAGDVLLLKRNSAAVFLWGMGAFALGHIGYILGFIEFGLSAQPENLSAREYVSVIAFGTILFFLSPLSIVQSVPKNMQIAVILYTLIILVMCVFAVLTWTPIIIFAAFLFAVSDHFVGKDRFIAHKPWHAFAITPFYFSAQALFALSVFELSAAPAL